MGLAGYYRKFIKDYSMIATLLTQLLTKGNFVWIEAATEAMNQLKAALTSASVLGFLDFSQPSTMETDASSFGIEAVLR